VGDEIRDHDAARLAGCAFAAVAWGYTSAEALLATGPALMLSDPGVLAALVTARRPVPVGMTHSGTTPENATNRA
jgi:phosphoglycolate phosphatase